MKKKLYADKAFQDLAIAVNKAIIENDGLIGDQKEQVELVFSLETKFKHFIQKYQKTQTIYEKFINMITQENKNILSARPYFREKSKVFSKGITEAIKNEDAKALMKYDINFQFINFIAQNWGGNFPVRVQKYYDNFLEARRILIENNLPLAINRAKLFYRKTPRSHLDLLDLIDICTTGLISGIDKYSGKYTRVWRSVCIGRMVGNMIEEYSKTFLRLYPTDKKILYRANSLRFRLHLTNDNMKELTQAVNDSFEQDGVEGKKIPKLPISEHYLQSLINGATYIPTDSKKSNNDSSSSDDGVGIYDYTSNNEEDIEEKIIKNDLIDKIIKATKELELMERKVIRLKGVNLDD